LGPLSAFLDADANSGRVLLLTGEPGIGKTTLWEHGVRAARERGFRVLAARASPSETRLAFAALGDLLGGIMDEFVGALPPPQRRAFEVALALAEAGDSPPDPRTIAVAVLSSLRAASQARPLLVAVDDVQWLDEASESALAFALRRLVEDRVTFLLAQRKETAERQPLGLDGYRDEGVERVEITWRLPLACRTAVPFFTLPTPDR
jgi:predicted ATPase